jgi:hypothetical protein
MLRNLLWGQDWCLGWQVSMLMSACFGGLRIIMCPAFHRACNLLPPALAQLHSSLAPDVKRDACVSRPHRWTCVAACRVQLCWLHQIIRSLPDPGLPPQALSPPVPCKHTMKAIKVSIRKKGAVCCHAGGGQGATALLANLRGLRALSFTSACC